MLERPTSPVISAPPIALCLVAAAIATAAAVAGVMAATRPSARSVDVCGLPKGIDFTLLGERDRSFALRRGLACADLVDGRMTLDEYRERVASLETVATVPVAPASPIWASRVLSFSSQWADAQWAATQALGPPNVFPASADRPEAWASRDADAAVEHLEVGFAEPRSLEALDLFETFNPGAVSRVEVVTASGKRQTVYDGIAAPMTVASYQRHIEFTCTAEPVVAVRITLHSAAVPGWNEIDAVGATACR